MNLGELTEHLHFKQLGELQALQEDDKLPNGDDTLSAIVGATAALVAHQAKQVEDKATQELLLSQIKSCFEGCLADYFDRAEKGGCAGCVLEAHQHHEPLN